MGISNSNPGLAGLPRIPPLDLVDIDALGDDTTLEEWAELLQAKEMQQSCIRRFLDLEGGGKVSQPKRERRATFWVLRALNHALTLATGRGLEGWAHNRSILKLLPKQIHDHKQF